MTNPRPAATLQDMAEIEVENLHKAYGDTVAVDGRGEAVLSPSVATRLLGQVRAPAQDELSRRELEVLEAPRTARRPAGCSSPRRP